MQSVVGKSKGEIHVAFSSAQSGRTLSLSIGAEIGRGSTSVVCMGHVEDGEGTETVAVKILRPSLASAPAAERFVREATLLCNLSHPNIARGLGTGTISRGNGQPEVPFLVLEFVEGTPLDEFILRRTFASDPRAALELLLGVSSALGYLHLDGRVQAHRDVKPANIIVCPDGVPKLIDRGIAKTHLVTGKALETRFAGTVRYMSPEQLADSSRVDIRSDIYALGIVLLEMLGCTGEWSHDGRKALAARFNRSPPCLSDRDARRLGLTGSHRAALDRLLAGACAYEPHERYQTPRDLTRAVEKTLVMLEGEPDRNVRTGPHRNMHKLVPIAICALCLACAAYVALARLPAGTHGPKAQPPPGREIVIGKDTGESEGSSPGQTGSSPLKGGI